MARKKTQEKKKSTKVMYRFFCDLTTMLAKSNSAMKILCDFYNENEEEIIKNNRANKNDLESLTINGNSLELVLKSRIAYHSIVNMSEDDVKDLITRAYPALSKVCAESSSFEELMEKLKGIEHNMPKEITSNEIVAEYALMRGAEAFVAEIGKNKELAEIVNVSNTLCTNKKRALDPLKKRERVHLEKMRGTFAEAIIGERFAYLARDILMHQDDYVFIATILQTCGLNETFLDSIKLTESDVNEILTAAISIYLGKIMDKRRKEIEMDVIINHGDEIFDNRYAAMRFRKARNMENVLDYKAIVETGNDISKKVQVHELMDDLSNKFADDVVEKEERFQEFLCVIMKVVFLGTLIKKLGKAYDEAKKTCIEVSFKSKSKELLERKLEKTKSLEREARKELAVEKSNVKRLKEASKDFFRDMGKKDKEISELEKQIADMREKLASYKELDEAISDDIIYGEGKEGESEPLTIPPNAILIGGHPIWQKHFIADHPEAEDLRVYSGTKNFHEGIFSSQTSLVIVNVTHIKHAYYAKVKKCVDRFGLKMIYVE